MRISKPLDFSENLIIRLDVEEKLQGHVSSHGQKATLMLHTNEESILGFLKGLNDKLGIKINNQAIELFKNGLDFSSSLSVPSDIRTLELTVDNTVLARYTIENGIPVLQDQALLDNHFIKNSILNKKINFDGISSAPTTLKTDLHTHYAGAPSSSGLLRCATAIDMPYPSALLEKAGIDIQKYQTVPPSSDISLKGLSLGDLEKLEQAMQVPVSEQIRFVGDKNLETIYQFRQPFFKNKEMVAHVLELIAQEYQKSNVSYVELSGSQVFDVEQDPSMLEIASRVLPQLEETYGVKLRFLGAMTRFDDVEWSLDQLEKLKLVARNPYIVGIDVVGHESNSTLDVVDNISPYMAFAKENGLDWTFRFHAGENPSHPENVKEALKLAKQYGVKVRIGHGLYGMDEETIQLAKDTRAIIEINSSSNLALNNVSDVEEMRPLIEYLNQGIDVVLGTDSPGVYQTSIPQELSIATRVCEKFGIPIQMLEKITQTENSVIKDDQKRMSHPLCSTKMPSPDVVDNLKKHWSPQVDRLKHEKRTTHLHQNIDKIKSLGALYIPQEELQVFFEKKNKIPFVISGASKSNWATLTNEEKEKIERVMIELVQSLDSKKYILVTGGTDYGVEKIVHDHAFDIEVLGVLTEEADASEIQNPNINACTIASGNWYAKSAFVMDNIIKPNQGKVLFVAGGSIVGDEILSGLYHKLPASQMLLMDNVGGSSSAKAKQNPQFSVDNLSDILQHIHQVSPQDFLSNIDKKRIPSLFDIGKSPQISSLR